MSVTVVDWFVENVRLEDYSYALPSSPPHQIDPFFGPLQVEMPPLKVERPPLKATSKCQYVVF